MKKWQLVDLLRTCCVIAVLGVHFYSNIPFKNPWVCWLWGRFCVNGTYGVFIFFIVSGFLITNVIAHNRGGIERPNLRQFYVQRIGRIWPLFFACFFIGVAVFWLVPPDNTFYRMIFPAGAYYGFWFWLSVPAFLFNWFLIFKPSWDYSVHWMLLWSLSIEEQFYLLYPFALGKLRKTKVLAIFLLAVILLALVWRIVFFFYDRSNDFIQSFPSTSKFDLIAMGVLLFLAVRRYGKALSQNKGASWALCLAGAAFSLAVYFGTQENNHLDEIYSSDLLGLGIFTFLLGGLHLPLFDNPYWKILAMPGKYCYGCYMLHPFVLLFLGSWLHSLNVFWGFSLFIVATTILGAGSFHLFETPVNFWFRRKFAGFPSPK